MTTALQYASALLLMLLCLTTQSLAGQQSQLTGVIAISNSKFETGKQQFVSNAIVQDDGAKAQSSLTDPSGRFKLTLVGVREQTKVVFTVKKQGMEVVNTDALQAVAGQTDQVWIYMSPLGKIAENKLRYYKINRDAAERHMEKQIDSLNQAILNLKTNFEVNKQIILRLENEMETLKEKIAQIDGLASKIAEEYSRINLDNKSVEFQNAFRKYQNGDYLAALGMLGAMNLDAQSAELLDAEIQNKKMKERYAIEDSLLKSRKRQTVEAIEFKSDLHRLNLQAPEEEQCFVLLLKLEPNNLNILQDYASFLNEQNRQSEALSIYQKIIGLGKSYGDRATAYRNVASIYTAQKDNVEAEKWLNQAKKEITAIRDSTEKWGYQVDNYFDLGDHFLPLNYWESFINFQLSIVASEKLASTSKEGYTIILLRDYIKISSALKYNGDTNSTFAREVYKKAKTLYEKYMEKDREQYQFFGTFFEKSTYDLMNEARQSGRETCPECEKAHREMLSQNRKEESKTGTLINRKEILVALAEMNKMGRNFTDAENFYTEALQISDGLRRRSPGRFELDYAEDVAGYIRFLSNTGRVAPDSLYQTIFYITAKYDHLEKARTLAERNFIHYPKDFDGDYSEIKEALNPLESALYFLEEGDDFKATANSLNEMVKILEKYHAKYPANVRAKKKLAVTYGKLAGTYLFLKKWKEAEVLAQKGIALDRTKNWIVGKLAIAQLYQGRYEEAKNLCVEYRNEYYYDGQEIFANTWIHGLCSDLNDLQDAMVTHPSVDKLRKEYKDDFWCDR